MWSFCYFGEGSSEKWPQRRVIGACGVTGCESHCWCCGDALTQALTVTDQEVRDSGKLGFCFVTVEGWPAGWVSPLFDFWAATNSWALTGHSGICFIRGERGGSRQATHLCDSSEPHATLNTLTSYSNYPTSALFVLSLTQIRLLRENDTGIKGTEQKVNVCWLPRTEEVKKGHILQVQLSGAVTCKTNRCSKTFLKRLSLDTGIVDLFSLKDLHFFHLLNPPDACHCTSYPSLDAEPWDRGKDQDCGGQLQQLCDITEWNAAS